jgi:hypothetical protein
MLSLRRSRYLSRYNDGPGIESLWRRVFVPVQAGPETHPTSSTMVTLSFPRVKRPGRGANHPTFSAKFANRLVLYLLLFCVLAKVSHGGDLYHYLILSVSKHPACRLARLQSRLSKVLCSIARSS